MIQFSVEQMSEKKAVIYLEGDLDIDSTEIVEEKILPQMASCQEIKLDFDKVPFVDSSGMGLLLNVVHSLKEKGTLVKIINVREDVQIVFDLLQISEILGEDTFV